LTAFEQYVPWYDLLYEDKDCAAVSFQNRCHASNIGHYTWQSTESPNSRTWTAYSLARKN
jgi:hypothetical protein